MNVTISKHATWRTLTRTPMFPKDITWFVKQAFQTWKDGKENALGMLYTPEGEWPQFAVPVRVQMQPLMIICVWEPEDQITVKTVTLVEKQHLVLLWNKLTGERIRATKFDDLTDRYPTKALGT